MKTCLTFFAVLCLATVTHARRIACDVVPIPTEFHNGSGYTALECGPDGRVYVGTAWYGGSAHLIRFEPETGEWEKIFDAHSMTREPITALDAQGKIHAKILADGDGIIWAATKHGNEAWQQRPEYGEHATGYPGGHLFSYNPATGQVIDHGILMAQNGIMGGVVDRERRRLYFVSDALAHFLVYDIDANTVRNLGFVGSIPRYMAIDQRGRVFTHGGMPNDRHGWRPVGADTPYLCMYDPETDRLYHLAVIVEGPEPEAYAVPYVLAAGADGNRLFGNATGGKYLMEFDLTTLTLDSENPMANGSIICRHVAEVPRGDRPHNQRAGVVGKDGRYYFVSRNRLFRYDAAERVLDEMGEIDDATFELTPRPYTCIPQGAAVAPDGTLYLKYIYEYRIIRFPQLTAP